MQTRLPLWQAALWVLLGAAAAQIAGGMVAALLRAWLFARAAHTHHAAPQAAVVVPALLASAATLITISLLAPTLAQVPLRRALGLRRAPWSCYLAAAVGTVMLGPTADAMMRAMQELLPDLSLGVVPMLHDLVRDMPVALAWPAFALLPGISEELLFRGLLQTAAERTRFAIALSALSFALFHLDPHHIAGVLPLGFFLAWVASRCGTLVTICAHVANNTAAIAALHSSTFDVGYGTEAPMPLSWLPASLAVVALCAVVIVRATERPAGGSLPGSETGEL